jgi:hypothetical protein
MRDPREEFDHLGKIVYWHKRYGFSGEVDGSVYGSGEDFIHAKGKEALCLPLFMLDHSSIWLSLSPFGDPWDSGQLGFYWASYKDIKETFMRKRVTKSLLEQAKKLMGAEIEEYNYYLNGEVYGYTIVDDQDPEGEIVSSCWGFYGYDSVKEGAEYMVNFYRKKYPTYKQLSLEEDK